MRTGIQGFNSDFRGFIFVDEDPAIRVFGNLRSNRINYNLAYFYLLEKDTNSGLNTFEPRNQQVGIANIYVQDAFAKGYTTEFSFHYNYDQGGIHYDKNGFLVRPAPIGSVVMSNGIPQPHSIRSFYLGWTGNGHIGGINVSNAFYQALGTDSFNSIAGRPVHINAQMGALELSKDRDWLRYRAAVFWASGDTESRVGPSRSTGTARGFDSILDETQFAGGQFSFFDREGIRLLGTGVALTTPFSLLPSLRSSKDEGQSNFVNPGIRIYNVGIDADLTPKLRAFANVNYLQFDRTETLRYLLFQSSVHRGVGTSGIGIAYRPPLTENIVLAAGVSALVPDSGLRNIYNSRVLISAFAKLGVQFDAVKGRQMSIPWKRKARRWGLWLLLFSFVIFVCGMLATSFPSRAAKQDSSAQTPPSPSPGNDNPSQSLRLSQTQQEADDKSAGCQSCHTATDSKTMHLTNTVRLGCTDCHGGDATTRVGAELPANSAEYQEAKKKAHPAPKILANGNGANPVRAYTNWLKEDWSYIKFVNPGDLRVAATTCGTAGCHMSEVQKVRTSMMTHGAMLWGAALYNNGAFPQKNPLFGESYSPEGTPQRLMTFPPPTAEETRLKGVLPYLEPLERWEISQPGNVLRIFERGGERKPEIGIPSLDEQPGKPDVKLGERGFGTLLRTDPVFLGLQKTRLFDPLLSFPGTNDQPGDYRNSGCTACHVVYGNDNSPAHSGPSLCSVILV